MRLLAEYFQEEERKLNESTVGVICSDCNKSAYYFRLKKVDFGSPKKCLICSDFKTSGIRLEDFIFTLNGHLHEHYKLDASNDTSNISLR